jgi:hypothetical protein
MVVFVASGDLTDLCIGTIQKDSAEGDFIRAGATLACIV